MKKQKLIFDVLILLHFRFIMSQLAIYQSHIVAHQTISLTDKIFSYSRLR